MNYKLSDRSKSRLIGVHPDLIATVYKALEISQIDFGVAAGLRTEAEQKQFVASGKSQTMNSKHLFQELRLPGTLQAGCAVDLFAWRNKALWDVNALMLVADAMLMAAKSLGVSLIWGAAWGRDLTDFDYSVQAYEQYIEEREKQGRTPFIDAPHFELERF